MIKQLVVSILIVSLLPIWTVGASTSVRIKDIAKILEIRDNQLMGFGLVVGLRNSGDSRRALFTNKALTNLLKKFGLSPDNNNLFQSRNVAGVIVTAKLPSFIKKGQKIPVKVSSIGDSSSLQGGTLLMTELRGANGQTYVVAQGTVIVGGVSGRSGSVTLLRDQTTVGRVPGGGIVEKEVPVTLKDHHHITIVLNESNFITASRVAKAISKRGFAGSYAHDATTIKIPLVNLENENMVDLIAEIEGITVQPDSLARVVINSRTGTIVVGEMVRLLPVAVTHGSISVRISSKKGRRVLGGGRKLSPTVQVKEPGAHFVQLDPEPSLNSLVKSLNKIGASPRDMISIIQALQESGALIADLEIL